MGSIGAESEASQPHAVGFWDDLFVVAAQPCGVNPCPRCPLTPRTTAPSTRQGEGLSQREHPAHRQGCRGGRRIGEIGVGVVKAGSKRLRELKSCQVTGYVLCAQEKC